MKIELQKSVENGGDYYNVICIKQGGIFDYYVQKVGYGDLMHICGLEKTINIPEDIIIKHIDIAIKNNFWME